MKKHATSYIALFFTACGVLLTFDGCESVHEKKAFLYSKSSEQYLRLAPNRSQFPFGGNFIQVPKDAIATVSLSQFKVGWLNNQNYKSTSHKNRDLYYPEKSLWLVVSVEGYQPDDFLRTSSKKSFLASAVKEDQESKSFLALDTHELNFKISTAEYKQHQIVISLYQVDNFRLKQFIATVAKDEQGFFLQGFNLVKTTGKKALGVFADPLFSSAQGVENAYGTDFLFERLLLQTGATKEFEGMLYLVTTDNVPLDKDHIKEYILADPALLVEPEKFQKLAQGKRQAQDSLKGAGKSTDVPSKSEIDFDAVRKAVNINLTAAFLEDPYSSYLNFDISYGVDKNSEEAQVGDAKKAVTEQRARLHDAIDAALQESLKKLKTDVDGYRDAVTFAQRSFANISSDDQAVILQTLTTDSAPPSEVSDHLIDFLKGKSIELSKAEIPTRLPDIKVSLRNILSKMGIHSTSDGEVQQQFDLKTYDSKFMIGMSEKKGTPTSKDLEGYLNIMKTSLDGIDKAITSTKDAISAIDDPSNEDADKILSGILTVNTSGNALVDEGIKRLFAADAPHNNKIDQTAAENITVLKTELSNRENNVKRISEPQVPAK